MIMKSTPIFFPVLFLAGLQTLTIFAQELPIIPAPSVIHPVSPGKCIITSSTVVVCDSGVELSAHYLLDYLEEFYGLDLSVLSDSKNTSDAEFIRLVSDPEMDPGHYILRISMINFFRFTLSPLYKSWILILHLDQRPF